MKRFYRISLIVCFIGSVALNVSAQKFIPEDSPATGAEKKVEKIKSNSAKTKKKDEKVAEKVKRLEDEVASMRAELEELKNLLKEKLKTEANVEKLAANVTPKPEKVAKADSATIANSAPKKSSKEDRSMDVGDYRITPYGIIFFNAFANSNGTNNTDDPLWATANRSGNSGASGRQTRLGVRISGGKIGDAKVSGVVEADFYGGFPGVGVGENMGILRLRVAKAQLDWEKTRLIIGQDWMLFAPNSPTSLAAAAIPQFAAAGNPWSRLPQIRVERKIGKHFKWQGAVLAPGTGDFPVGGSTPALLQPSSGSASKTPFFQSRISYSHGNWFGSKKRGTVGFSGHFGRSKITAGAFTDDIDSYGLSADWKFPIVKRVSLSGEAFFGKNLGGFQGGIFQGYNTSYAFLQNNTLVAGGIRGIRTRGGWTQLGWNLPAVEDKLTLYGSLGVDDPDNQDLVSINNRNFRTRNFGYAFDAIYEITPKFSLGGEFRRLETSYFFTPKQEANHVNFGAAFKF